jgi:ATP-binding cassette subfamily B protein
MNIRTVKTFSAEETENEKYEVNNNHLYQITTKRVIWHSIVTTILNVNGYFVMMCIVWKGSSMVGAGEVTIGTLATFMMQLTIITW